MNKKYLITYVLKTTSGYGPFFDAIKSLGNWSHYLDDVWLIKNSKHKSSKEIYEALAPHLKPTDRILVVEIGTDYWGILPKEAWPWFGS